MTSAFIETPHRPLILLSAVRVTLPPKGREWVAEAMLRGHWRHSLRLLCALEPKCRDLVERIDEIETHQQPNAAAQREVL